MLSRITIPKAKVWGRRMDNQLLAYSGLLLASVFISSISQVMLKKAAQKHYESVLKEYLNPLVVSAYVIFLCCTFLTLYSLKVVPLGLGAVFETTGYIYVTIFGVLIFKEKMNSKKLLALALIIGGIAIYALLG